MLIYCAPVTNGSGSLVAPAHPLFFSAQPEARLTVNASHPHEIARPLLAGEQLDKGHAAAHFAGGP
jgi:hypothetical protein